MVHRGTKNYCINLVERPVYLAHLIYKKNKSKVTTKKLTVK